MTDARLRLAFYGDDFTGSTDALEVLAFAGLRCALFLKPPTRDMLAALGGFDAIGVAGDGRAMTPAEMDAALPPVFEALAALRAPIIHYKVCSTFDSAPHIGSIGRVMELARASFGPRTIPIVAGTPALKRFCVFGNLFARSGTDGLVYRIDRHPIMRAHPVTPMDEGDLLRHFARQTNLPLSGFHLPDFDGTREQIDQAFHHALGAAPAGLLLDTASPAHLTEVGRLLSRLGDAHGPVFAVGSSGLEYALTQWWNESRTPGAQTRGYDRVDAAAPILALSGSASPLSAAQIDAAIGAGFAGMEIDARALIDTQDGARTLDAIVSRALHALGDGQSVIMHTARGPRDQRIGNMLDALVAQGMSLYDARHRGGRLLGQRLGAIADAVLRAVPLRRLILSGGDTSSQVTQVLGPDALEIDARLTPGAPLCRVISDKPHLRDLRVALKGGQMGDANFFVTARDGNVN
ncbi:MULTISPECIES: four-carbon acid sugar kinase family protein [unclassified Caballeronia]|uniref:four-carbon acid sugar kinase family protein n=1 Tax=unclassified Caballeronia TaxID=2646786 RepID=UPI00285D0C46|nr:MULTISPECIES: four-carbon acid sugar kinase family protein [unclassified Caballeronia]MDR5741135.1 four-carbon acid sugar kinase family protein [Caballeronia sp. LZ016]MDR5807035.1 four-carbon acid sugar kinase family protein [Caballeronia sp. LZ019]